MLRGTVKNVTELGTHRRRNFLAGRDFMSMVCQEEKERERKDSRGVIFIARTERRDKL